MSGGQGEIRTHDTLARIPDFESGAFDHSATCPGITDFAAARPTSCAVVRRQKVKIRKYSRFPVASHVRFQGLHPPPCGVPPLAYVLWLMDGRQPRGYF